MQIYSLSTSPNGISMSLVLYTPTMPQTTQLESLHNFLMYSEELRLPTDLGFCVLMDVDISETSRLVTRLGYNFILR